MRQRLVNLAIGLMTALAAPLIVTSVVSQIFARRQRLAGTRRLILGAGGFGWTIVASDAARRIWDDERSAIVFIGPAHRYNPVVEEIFPDITVFIVPIRSAFRLFGRPFPINTGGWLLGLLHRVVGTVFGTLPGRDVISWRYGFHDSLPEKDLADSSGGRLRLAPAVHRANAFPRYYRLRERIAAPPARLPCPLRHVVREALKTLDTRTGHAARGLCCLYLRDKGGEDAQRETYVRTGSPVSDYIPAISFLVSVGFRVMFIGDKTLDPAIAEKFCGMLVDHSLAAVDPNLFSLFAATECDFSICEAGGGVNVPMVADKPMLLVNWLQYFAAVPRAAHHYKLLMDSTGAEVEREKLFNEYAFDQRFDDMQVCNNTPVQIETAVRDFVERFESGKPLGLDPSVLGDIDPDIWLNFARCWISAPWMRISSGHNQPADHLSTAGAQAALDPIPSILGVANNVPHD